jgi:hypothetical protein
LTARESFESTVVSYSGVSSAKTDLLSNYVLRFLLGLIFRKRQMKPSEQNVPNNHRFSQTVIVCIGPRRLVREPIESILTPKRT